MTRLAKSISKTRTFKDYLTPDYLIISNDLIVGQDNGVTIVRLIDEVTAFAFPIQLTRFVVVSQFARNESVPTEEFMKAKLSHKLILVNPAGEEFELGNASIVLNSSNPWTVSRSISDLSGQLAFKEAGVYTFKVLGRADDSDFEELLVKKLPTKLATGVPGFYAAEFSADQNWNDEDKKGAGFVLLMPDGRIQGTDLGYIYSGNYKLDGEQVTANLSIRRTNPEINSIFGNIEEFEIQLKGDITSDKFLLSGVRKGGTKDKIWLNLKRQTRLPGNG